MFFAIKLSLWKAATRNLWQITSGAGMNNGSVIDVYAAFCTEGLALHEASTTNRLQKFVPLYIGYKYHDNPAPFVYTLSSLLCHCEKWCSIYTFPTIIVLKVMRLSQINQAECSRYFINALLISALSEKKKKCYLSGALSNNLEKSGPTFNKPLSREKVCLAV